MLISFQLASFWQITRSFAVVIVLWSANLAAKWMSSLQIWTTLAQLTQPWKIIALQKSRKKGSSQPDLVPMCMHTRFTSRYAVVKVQKNIQQWNWQDWPLKITLGIRMQLLTSGLSMKTGVEEILLVQELLLIVLTAWFVCTKSCRQTIHPSSFKHKRLKVG